MKLEYFKSPMHPAAKHNYAVDFTDLLAALGAGSDVLTGVPSVTVDGDTPAGLTISSIQIVGSDLKVQWNVDIDSGEHGATVYQNGGTKVCFNIACSTVAGDDLFQQAILTISDQCD